MSKKTAFVLFAAATSLLTYITVVRADDFAERLTGKIPCPTAEPCKILILSAQEEKILTGQNGILDTAAQARAIDLGQFSVYLKTRIASAPAGEPVKPAGVPAPPEKHDAPESAKP